MSALGSIVQKDIDSTLVAVGTTAGVTGPATGKTWVIGALTVCNTDAATYQSIDVCLTRGGVNYYIVKNFPLPVGETVAPVGAVEKMVMIASDTIQVKGSVAGKKVDAILSYAEEP